MAVLEDTIATLRRNLLEPAMTRPGLLRFGGNVMQLDNHGAQIRTNGSQTTAIWFTKDIVPDPSTLNGYGYLSGNIADNLSNQLMGAGSANTGGTITGAAATTWTAASDGTTEQGVRHWVGDNTGETGSAWLYHVPGDDVARFMLGLGSGASPTVLKLQALSSDNGTPADGEVWYYNNKLYARINGATVELGGGGSMPMPPIVSTLGWHGVGSQIITAVSPTSQAWPTSNKAIFVPITVTEDITVVKLWVMNGATASGNLNMSLYDSSFAQVANSEIGSTAQTGTNVIQELDITNVTLTAGLYYIALVLDNTTGTVFGRTSPFSTTEGLQSMGMFEQTSSFDLPATATPAVMAANLIPFCGISTRTLVT